MKKRKIENFQIKVFLKLNFLKLMKIVSPVISLISSVFFCLSNFTNFGPFFFYMKKFTVPQKFFSHFYVVAMAWTTLLLVTTWIYAYKMAPVVTKPFHYSTITSHLTGRSHIFSWDRTYSSSMKYRYEIWQSVFLLLLMELQVLRRFYETIYVFNYSPSARMHIFGYLTGLL